VAPSFLHLSGTGLRIRMLTGMKYIYILLIFFSVSVWTTISYAQDNTPPEYGIDPDLLNGRRYSSNLSHNIQGHPYFFDPVYEPGSLMIRGNVYDGVLLNYDIYNQELVLRYQKPNNSFDFIALSKAWLDGFHLQGRKFVLLGIGEGKKEYFQVIGQDSLEILYYWEKELILSKEPGNTHYSLSEPSRTMYLYRNGEFYLFRNNREYVNFFGPTQKEQMKNYIRENRINVRKAPDELMLKLLSFTRQTGI
jgi:hypothetical protein